MEQNKLTRSEELSLIIPALKKKISDLGNHFKVDDDLLDTSFTNDIIKTAYALKDACEEIKRLNKD